MIFFLKLGRVLPVIRLVELSINCTFNWQYFSSIRSIHSSSSIRSGHVDPPIKDTQAELIKDLAHAQELIKSKDVIIKAKDVSLEDKDVIIAKQKTEIFDALVESGNLNLRRLLGEFFLFSSIHK